MNQVYPDPHYYGDSPFAKHAQARERFLAEQKRNMESTPVGYAPPQPANPPEPSELEIGMKNLEEQLDAAHSLIAILGSRLRPVLATKAESGTEPSYGHTPSMTMLGSQLDAHAASVYRLARRIEDLINNLGV